MFFVEIGWKISRKFLLHRFSGRLAYEKYVEDVLYLAVWRQSKMSTFYCSLINCCSLTHKKIENAEINSVSKIWKECLLAIFINFPSIPQNIFENAHIYGKPVILILTLFSDHSYITSVLVGGEHCVFKWILRGHLKPTPNATISIMFEFISIKFW